jgi:hypothetical protein
VFGVDDSDLSSGGTMQPSGFGHGEMVLIRNWIAN